MIVAGIRAGLVAARFGLIGLLKIPSGTGAKSVALVHGGGNVVVLLLFAARNACGTLRKSSPHVRQRFWFAS
jgi:uncharacterized membrane protein